MQELEEMDDVKTYSNYYHMELGLQMLHQL